MKREAEFQTLWHHYLDSHPLTEPEVYELKLCKTLRFPFSSVKENQIEGLLQAQKGLFHKISDSPVSWGMKTKMRFTQKKPFDCLWIKGAAFVCVLFYIPRQPKKVAVIPINHFIYLRDTWPKKSITYDELIHFGASEVVL